MNPGDCASDNIWYIVDIALLIRTVFALSGYLYTHDLTIFYTPDSASYIVPAHELIAHHRFFSDGTLPGRVWNSPVGSGPEIIRTPGYPFLLAFGMLMGRFGITTVVLQILLNCLTVFFVYKTASLLFESESIALIAASLYAVDPLSVLFSSLISTETLFTIATIIGIYCLVAYLRFEPLRYLLISAIAFATSVYVRPGAYLLPFVLASGVAGCALIGAQHNQRRLICHLSAFLAVTLGLTLPWQVRNHSVVQYSGFSSVFSEDMYCCQGAAVLAAINNSSYVATQDRLGCYDPHIYFRKHPEQRSWSLARILAYKRKQAVLTAAGNPLIFLGIYLSGVLRTVFDPLSTEVLRFFDLYPKDGGLLETALDKGLLEAAAALKLSPVLMWCTLALLLMQFVYIWSACAAFSGRVFRDPAFLAMLIVVVYYLLLPGGPAGWGRFRHPAMPMMCVLGGMGYSRCSIA